MAIKFRCTHCNTLMAISGRKAGAMVRCAACDEEVLVPLEDAANPPAIAPAPGTRAAADLVEENGEDRVALPEDLFHFDDEPEDASEHAPSHSADEPAFPWGNQTLDFLYATDSPAVESAAAVAKEVEPVVPATTPEPRQELESDHNPFQIKLRKSRIDDEMDLTPMVDVVFQLLIFFMVTASFALHKTIQTPTPEENQKGATQSIQSLEELEGVAILVRIDGKNGIYIDDDPLSDEIPVADALTDRMRKDHKSEVIITADPASWHRTVVKVVDAANEVGMQKIRLATKSGAGE